MFVNQPDDAQLVALWDDPETCPAIARRLGVSQTSGSPRTGGATPARGAWSPATAPTAGRTSRNAIACCGG